MRSTLRFILGTPAVTRSALIASFTVLIFSSVAISGCGLFSKTVDVLYIGDSIMNQTGQFAEYYLADQPNVGSASTHVEAVNGTGLLTPTLLDWQVRAKELINIYQPKVVVVLFIGNYTDKDLWVGSDGQTVPNDYGPRFFTEWEGQAEKLNSTLSAGGAEVDWVLPPPLAGDEGKRRQETMRATYTDLKNRVPAIALIDGREPLAGPNGDWVWQREGVDSGNVTVRQGDSVHLTEDGGRLMARQIALTVGPQVVAIRTKPAT